MKPYLFLALSACLLLPLRLRADWPQYQHDAAHTGRTDAVIDPNQLTLAWTAPNYTAPLLVGDTVYGTIPGSSTTVTAFALSDGTVKWSYTADNLFIGHPAVRGKVVAILGYDFSQNSNTLTILDADTGLLRYQVPVGGQFAFIAPVLAPDETNGGQVAYCASSDVVTAVSLGRSAGAILWSQNGEFGGDSFPTVAGESIILAGPGQYYAFDRTTGEPNHFHSGDIEGGGGVSVAFDSTRSQFYIQEAYNAETAATLTAYHYINNQDIELVWQRQGGIPLAEAGSVAIASNGFVYSATPEKMLSYDPDTGATLRGVNTSFATNVTPAITKGLVWAFTQTQTLCYDLATFRLMRAFDGSRGDLNSPYSSPGAFQPGAFVLDRGTQLDVYLASSQ
jgi:outer membrane protein assembly factor BamB